MGEVDPEERDRFIFHAGREDGDESDAAHDFLSHLQQEKPDAFKTLATQYGAPKADMMEGTGGAQELMDAVTDKHDMDAINGMHFDAFPEQMSQAYPRDEYLQSSLPQASNEEIAAVNAAIPDKAKFNRGSVNLSDLTGTQLEVGKSDVAKMRGAVQPPLQVVRMNGKNFLWDGHHRVEAALADGRDALPADILDLSKQ